jgi:competence/damage-inducible protein CinA-like protein
VRVVVLTIGDELLRGDVVDTNAAWLGRRLFELGHLVAARVTVGDTVADIVRGLIEVGARADVAIVSGGLGPTEDDRTAEAAARAAQVGRTPHEPSLGRMRERFAKLGLHFTPNNERQALLPDGAEALGNDHGTAPGFALSIGGCRCYFLPGVPRELRPMFDEKVAPRLPGEPLFARTLHVFGMGESHADHALRDLQAGAVQIHYQTRFPENLVKLVSRDAAELARVEAEVRSRLGAAVYAADDESLAAVVGADLRARGATLGLAESCTGGLLGHLITEVPGSSDYLRGGVVAYADDAKEVLLVVPRETLLRHGAVSAQTAMAMAEGARRVFAATYGLATTGVAGPGGGSAEKPVGTFHVAVASPDGSVARHRVFPGERGRIKLLAAWSALDLLRRVLRGDVRPGA